jgi:chromate reductase
MPALFPILIVLLAGVGLAVQPPTNAALAKASGSVWLASLVSFAMGTAILFATPEYNSSIPGQLKNAVDWASRPLATAPLRNKPVAVVGASTGMFGGVWAQAELRKVLASTGARVLDLELAVPLASSQFDEAGRLADDELRARLAEVAAQVVAENAVTVAA